MVGTVGVFTFDEDVRGMQDGALELCRGMLARKKQGVCMYTYIHISIHIYTYIMLFPNEDTRICISTKNSECYQSSATIE